jgi:hypothetical protein
MANTRTEVGFGQTNEIICKDCGHIESFNRNFNEDMDAAHVAMKTHDCFKQNPSQPFQEEGEK